MDTGTFVSQNGSDSILLFSNLAFSVCLTISNDCGNSSKICKTIPAAFISDKKLAEKQQITLPICRMCGPFYSGTTERFTPDITV
ncbi:MAG: hypothetical protein R2879_14465 [Saprospiraceae bacterium]